MPARSALLAVPLTLALAAPAAAQQPAAQPAPGGTVTAFGQGTVVPKPGNRDSEASIAAAVAKAQRDAVPLALAAAKTRALVLATEAGLTLGALQSVADTGPAGFGWFGGYGEAGTFGPGKFCGRVARFKTVKRADGTRRRVRTGTRRTCRVPSQVAAALTVTFATVAPAPAPAP